MKRPLTGIATVDAVVGGNARQLRGYWQSDRRRSKYQEIGALTSASKFSAKMPDLNPRLARPLIDGDIRRVPGLQVNELTAHTEYNGRRVESTSPDRAKAEAGRCGLG